MGGGRCGESRGYGAAWRDAAAQGGVVSRGVAGEPTEGKGVLCHCGSLWLRSGVQGNFIHTAFSEGKRDQNSILRMHEVLAAVLEWIPTWEDNLRLEKGLPADSNLRLVERPVRIASSMQLEPAAVAEVAERLQLSPELVNGA